MIPTVGKQLDSFDGFIPVPGVPPSGLVMLLESSTNKGLTNIRYTLISEIVREFEPVVFGLVQSFTLEKFEPFRIPCAPTRVSPLREA